MQSSRSYTVKSTVKNQPQARKSAYLNRSGSNGSKGTGQKGDKPRASTALKCPGVGGECLLFMSHGHGFPVSGVGSVLTAWAEPEMPIHCARDDIKKAADGGGSAEDKEEIGVKVQWNSKPCNEAPAWSVSRPMGFVLEKHLKARICFMLKEQDKVIGTLSIPVMDLLGKGLVTHELEPPTEDPAARGILAKLMNSPRPTQSPRTSPRLSCADKSTTASAGDYSPACTISFQVVDQKAVIHKRTVFFIRHAESVWNQAQSSNNFYEMLKATDHPLSMRGRIQAEDLSSRIQAASEVKSTRASVHHTANMMQPDVIYVSPLTRAVQTAVIALQPVFKKSDAVTDIVFMSAAREKQNLGGMDTKATAVGADIVQKSLHETRTLYKDSEDKSVELSFRSLAFDIQEVEETWWHQGAKESKEDVEARLHEFMSQLLYSPHDTIIVVGHSHFFRAVFQEYLSDAFLSMRPGFAERLKSGKLMNCGVARVVLDPGLVPDSPIADVELVLDTDMIPHRQGFIARTCSCFSGKKAGEDTSGPSGTE